MPEIELLLEMLDSAYNRQSWHGANLRGALRGIAAEQAVFRPAAQRHNIWELAVHAAYWKYTVRRRLLNERRGSFPLRGSNWFSRPEPGAEDESAWRRELRLLDEMHRTLRTAVESFPPEKLHLIPVGSKTSFRKLVMGVASHDLYHAGQVQLLKRLADG